MPEIFLGHNAFFREVTNIYKTTKKSIGRLRVEEVQPLAEVHTEELLGIGDNNVVVSKRSDKASSISYRGISVFDAKELYYTHRVLHYLFPHNFPRVHAVFGKEFLLSDTVSGSVRQRIYQRENTENHIVRYPLQNVFEEMQKIPIFALFDHNPANVLVGRDGGEYFVDTVHAYTLPSHKENILRYAHEKGYLLEHISVLDRSIKRLEEVRAQKESLLLHKTA